MAEDLGSGIDELIEDEVDRGDTAIRLALTLLFVVIAAVVESVIGVIVAFELLWTLITRQPPSPRVRELSNRVISYYYRIGRYLTYNESRVPFPFTDFPAALEGDAWSPDERESEALGLPRLDAIDEDEELP